MGQLVWRPWSEWDAMQMPACPKLVWMSRRAPPHRPPPGGEWPTELALCTAAEEPLRLHESLGYAAAFALHSLGMPLPLDDVLLLLNAKGELLGCLPGWPTSDVAATPWYRALQDALHAAPGPHWSSLQPPEQEVQGRSAQPEQLLEGAAGLFGGWEALPKRPHTDALLTLSLLEGIHSHRRAGFLFLQTLKGLFSGGTFDLVDGGVFAASADHRWQLPVPQKRMGDQILLLWALLLHPEHRVLPLGRRLMRQTALGMLQFFDTPHRMASELRWSETDSMYFGGSSLQSLVSQGAGLRSAASLLGLAPALHGGERRLPCGAQLFPLLGRPASPQLRWVDKLLGHLSELRATAARAEVTLAGPLERALALWTLLVSGEALGMLGLVRFALRGLRALLQEAPHVDTWGAARYVATWSLFLREGRASWLTKLHKMELGGVGYSTTGNPWVDLSLHMVRSQVAALLQRLPGLERPPSVEGGVSGLLPSLVVEQAEAALYLMCADRLQWNRLRQLIRPHLPGVGLLIPCPTPAELSSPDAILVGQGFESPLVGERAVLAWIRSAHKS